MRFRIMTCVWVVLSATALCAGPVDFDPDVTAIFSQGCCDGGSGGGADELVNGSLTPGSGWAHAGFEGTVNEAVMELASPSPAAGGGVTNFVFTMISGGYGHHELGRFRISVTTDSNASYGDGLDNGGDVTANWTPIALTVVSSKGDPTSTGTFAGTGVALTPQGDLSVLGDYNDGDLPEYGKYVLSGTVPFGGITGIRLETIPDASLPFGLAGMSGVNGNYVVVEFSADLAVVPEPASLAVWSLVGLTIGGAGWYRRRRRA